MSRWGEVNVGGHAGLSIGVMRHPERKSPALIEHHHTPLCPACQTQRSQWLDYRLPTALGFVHGSGAPYDVSPAGVRDRHRSRFQEWKDTIAFHRDLIARTCRAQGHTGVVTEPAPLPVIQLDLLELLEAA
ncbi:hypothetical protein GCM10010172_35130 [Paractinoplanes ferrugineus]|uniref:Uncharacterized protein n=1 Tax=Paractinoplanes ferrugineus TaxID=113564 RepID=A0A919JBH6_9ACTN|nr:hypothetical protein [Actinoplanes ferrugineus]GIE16777.1 hypothetical protein Afe05nite_86170 [Actinoplanes ferrugineus]